MNFNPPQPRHFKELHMHAETAPISSNQGQLSMAITKALARSKQMRQDHGDTSFAIRDVLLGMIDRAPDTRTILVSPVMAARILDEANFPDQRKITSDRLYAAKLSITDGTWNPHHVIHFVLLDDGALWLVNGQTRLAAIAAVGAPQKVGVIIQRVLDENEARTVYTQFDSSSGVRTPQQILNASGIASEHGLARDYTARVFSAVGFISSGMVISRGSAADAVAARNIQNRMAAVGDWAVEARKYYADLEGSGKSIRRLLTRAGTLAVALVTYRFDEGLAHDFWPRVADMANLRKNDPRLALARDLQNRNAAIGFSNQAIQQSALAWNAYCQGRDLKIIKCVPDWHLFIAGTPYCKRSK